MEKIPLLTQNVENVQMQWVFAKYEQ